MPRSSTEEVAAYLAAAFPGVEEFLVVEEVGERSARVRSKFTGRGLRPGGTISGPTLMTLADTAMWVALLGEVGIEGVTVTTHLSIDFLRRPAPRDVIAVTELLKVGRRLATGVVTMYSDADPEPVATATVSYTVPHPSGS
ncbi:MAG: PaaI family thioesterase [Acidimicrobiia bacterium]